MIKEIHSSKKKAHGLSKSKSLSSHHIGRDDLLALIRNSIVSFSLFALVSFSRSVSILIIQFNSDDDTTMPISIMKKIESFANLYNVFFFFLLFFKNKPFSKEFKRFLGVIDPN